MRVKYTPGPWIALVPGRYPRSLQQRTDAPSCMIVQEPPTKVGGVICYIKNDLGAKLLTPQDIATAHLIEAAPDLYEALKETAADLVTAATRLGMSKELVMNLPSVKAAYAALTKAEGTNRN